MGWPLKTDFIAGYPLASIPAEWLNTVGYILNDISGTNCHVEKTVSGLGWQIIVDSEEAGGGIPHFHIAVGGSLTEIYVYGGSWERYAHGTQYTIHLSVDAGTSETITAYKTLTGITSDKYVVLTLTNGAGTFPSAVAPVTLEASVVAAWPTGETHKVKYVIGKVHTSGGVITAIEQYHRGGDISDFYAAPDSTTGINDTPQSLEYGLVAGYAGSMGWYGWAGATNTTPATGDLFGFKDISAQAGNGQLNYANCVTIVNTGLGDTGGDPPALNPLPVAHHALVAWDGWMTAGADWNNFDDHGIGSQGQLTGELENGFPLMVLGDGNDEAKADMYLRNSVTNKENYMGRSLYIETAGIIEGTALGDSGSAALQVAGGADFGSGTGTYSLRTITSSEALISVDGTRTVVLTDGADAVNATDGTTTTRILSAIAGIDSTNGTQTVVLVDGTYAANATAGGINVNAPFPYYHNAIAGQTTAQVSISLTGGGTVTGYFRGGIFTAT